MRSSWLVSIPLVLTLAACAAPSGPAVAPAPARSARVLPPTPPTPAYEAAPKNWQLMDAVADGVQGTGSARAERELLGGARPLRTVVVAIIDGGVDTAHADLQPNLWRNPRETANGKDDDGDGLTDDTWGWNYLGGADGRNVGHETLELTREYVRCTAPGSTLADSANRSYCATVTSDFTARRGKAEQQVAQLGQISMMYDNTARVLQGAMPGQALTPESVKALVPANDTVRAAQDLYLRFAANGITEAEIKEGMEQVRGQAQYGLNPEYNPRTIVGDDPRNAAQARYGNRDVTGPEASHGTHVAGIVGAVRGAEGIDGVAAGVQLMAVRAVPQGDERDKDVALAIRYAVDHGAHIINMSFGKDYSPEKSLVDDAVRYAVSKGVLLVHAAGNDGKNLGTGSNFPKAQYLGGGEAATWIEVGASSWRGGAQLAAPFSNYGKLEVDLFAPGVDITSTYPGGGYKANSGTSMAAPVVSGVAALLMSHFPKLTAADVKRILLETTAKYPDLLVQRPGGEEGDTVRFGDLSRTGGVVDAYAAVQAALAMGAKAR